MTWPDDFTTAVAQVVLAKGRPATPYDPDYYASWVYGNYHDDYREIKEHAKTCPFTATGQVAPVEWSEFTDTEAPNLNKHGLTAQVSCACGLYQDVTWLYEADLGTAVRDLLAVDPHPMGEKKDAP
jgi:hypothetical protein